MNQEPSSDMFDQEPLQAALRAAFGRQNLVGSTTEASVLVTIEHASGVSSRVLLREEPDEQAGLVVAKPGSDAGRSACGRYPIDGEIARGGIGVILLGRDPDLGRDVAMKRLRLEHSANPVMIQRLIEEAQIGGQLQHPGILPVYELGVDAEMRPFFTMKLVRGRTLATLLGERANPEHDRRRYLGIFEQICQTVAYAHARGVIHRDLKPSNVLVGSFGEVQVVDWGLAKVLSQELSERESAEQGTLKQSGANELNHQAESKEPRVSTSRGDSAEDVSAAGSVFGTPAYMAPEQARGAVTEQDERCDAFALGSILCEVLTGLPAYTGTRAEIMRKAAEGDLRDALARLDRCQVDSELTSLARQCLSAERADRPRDAVRIAHLVSAYLAKVEERARASELAAVEARAVLRSERRMRRLTVMAALLAVALTAASFAMFASERRRANAEARATAEARGRLEAERERSTALERALQVFVMLQGKGEYLLSQAAEAEPDKAEQWADLMGYVRKALEQALPGLNHAEQRVRARMLIGDLRRKEVELRRKSESQPSPRK